VLDELEASNVGGAELGQVPELPLSALRPAPENDQLYRRVCLDDPEIKALAESIRREGVLVPLVVSEDNYIISGHRRYAAAKLAGLRTVPCRVESITHDDPHFLVLLRECNRQRVKSSDEVVREEIVSANPEESHRFLQEHRRKKAELSAETIQIQGRKSRAEITKAKAPFLDAIRHVLDEHRKFLPLTDRRIHYALLNDPPLIHASKPESRYQNSKQSYKALCELLTRARLAGKIPVEWIHDPTRPVVLGRFDRELAPFVRREVDDFLKGYYRDLQQSQPNHIEIVGEKNTIDSVIRPLAMEYCIPMTIGRGYCSLPPRDQMAKRFRASGKEKLVILTLSDFDPEGENIAQSFAQSMRDDFGINAIELIKVALTAQQVKEMQLPPQMKAKTTSSRCKGFTEKHGDDVFELEAVRPDRLQAILREKIDGVLDLDAYNAEIDREKADAAYLELSRRRMQGVLKDSMAA
jgi:ParB/RepB/Spo0J family partition protein